MFAAAANAGTSCMPSTAGVLVNKGPCVTGSFPLVGLDWRNGRGESDLTRLPRERSLFVAGWSLLDAAAAASSAGPALRLAGTSALRSFSTVPSVPLAVASAATRLSKSPGSSASFP